jgi:hypothetical protein
MTAMKRKSTPVLLEVTPSRWDDEPISRAKSALLGLTSLGCWISLEFAATSDAVRFYVRAASRQLGDRAQAQLGAAYPQAIVRQVSIQNHPELDPTFVSPAEQVSHTALSLDRDASLPLKSDWRHERDPLSSPLAAAATLNPGERVVSQIILSSAPVAWGDRLRSRLLVSDDKSWRTRDVSPVQEVMPFLALFGIGAVGLQAYEWYQAGQLVYLAGAGATVAVGLPVAALVASRFMFNGAVDARIIKEKLAHPAFSAQLRVTAFGPADSSPMRLRSLVGRVAGAYRAFDHPSGQSLRPRSSRWPATRAADILNAAELAGLWHLPCDVDAGPIERASSRRAMPQAEDVSRGCRVGMSAHQATATPVHMPLSLLTRNQLIVAKTRRGKSTLLLHIASHLMERMASGHERMLLVVVDPHQDLAEAVLSEVPSEIEDRVTYLNAANRERPPGLNLLDVALFPERDRTSENVITMMHRLWPDNWGPRMEGALRACLSCLHEANSARDRDKQYTLLDVVPMLTSVDFKDEVLTQVPDRALWVWWRDNYDKINRTFQQQTANPVTTKIGRFMITEASRLILGQARSTLDLRAAIHDGGVLVVNSSVGALGEGAAALIGATLLNLVGLLAEEQVSVPPAERCRLVVLVDESSTLGATDYGQMLSELGKYGASFVLVTQSLAKLDAIDRALKPTIFSNIDGLTVFQVSAEDARYLVPELGGDLDISDLTDLSDFECYVRWSAGGRHLPVSSLRIDPPPVMNRKRVLAIAARSAERIGRPHDEVWAEIQQTLEGRAPPAKPKPEDQAGDSAQATDTVAESQPTSQSNPTIPDRSNNRPRK